MARLGQNGYRALFALVSIAGLALIVWGYGQYRAHELIQVWSPPAFMRHITVGLMLFAVIFFTAAFIPSHIKAKLKHPMLAGVKTWALAHLLSNGDLGSILLFGAFLAWGVYARIAAKRRGDARHDGSAGRLDQRHHRRRDRHRHLSRARLRLPSDGHRRAGLWEVNPRVSARRDQAAHRPGHFRPQGRRADRVPDLVSRAYRASGRQILRRDPGRRLARHGDARAGNQRSRSRSR